MEIRKERSRLARATLRGLAGLIYWHKRLIGWPLDRKIPSRPPKRIAVFVSHGLLGAGTLISAVCKMVKLRYPEATLYIVGEQKRSGQLAAFFREHTCVDDLIICPERGGSSWAEWWAFYKRLKSYRLDMCVCSPNHSCSNSVFLYLCGIPERLGAYMPDNWPWHAQVDNWFLTSAVTYEHMDRRPFQLLAFPQAYGRVLTGRKDFRLSEIVPYVRFTEESVPALERAEGAVVLHPGGPLQRRWPSERFAAIGTMVARKWRAGVFVTGGLEEDALGRQIVDRIRASCPEAVVYNCCGSSLNRTMNLVGRARLYIGNNAGALQIPVALGTTAIGIFEERERWWHSHAAGGGDHVVVSGARIQDISTQEVWNAVERAWTGDTASSDLPTAATGAHVVDEPARVAAF